MKKIIVFTDLDGTLLDSATYSFEKALPALELLKQNNFPLVICSSKTRREIERYREKLGNNDPFISENGGGIFIPKNYFNSRVESPGFNVDIESDYDVIRLGAKYSELRKALNILKEKGFGIKGFGDMTAEELKEIAGLSIAEADMSKERDFDEPFIFEGNEQELFNAITIMGFNYTKSEFYHILGNSDKGKAVSILAGLYRKEYGLIFTVALGDNPNDIPMLEIVDCPVVVKKRDGSYDPGIKIAGIIRAEGIGPEGWDKAVSRLVLEAG
ncbi:MAG: HAD-IIB family hydrolase [Nitrospirota bacterium]